MSLLDHQCHWCWVDVTERFSAILLPVVHRVLLSQLGVLSSQVARQHLFHQVTVPINPTFSIILTLAKEAALESPPIR